jgi:murein L,D-transpeptidase YafK
VKRLALLVLALAFCGAAAAATPEDRLSTVFEAIEANKLDVALKRVDALLADYPHFRLAHLVRGDLLLARARPLLTFGNVVKTVPQERVDGLREEALARLRAARQRPGEDRLPRYVLQLHPEQKHALVVDSRRSRLYVYANDAGKPKLIADYYVTLGKNGIDKTREGDQKTPVGVYHVTANLPRKKLTDFYGAGAFPINYPNEWDRRQGRNGHGIWLHGVPSDVYSRPPRASDGCIVLANPDLESLGQRLQIGLTPVIIADEIEWTDRAALEGERAGLAAAVEQWRADWQSRDTERYLAHYSQRFASSGQDFAAWAAHKRKVNAGKSWIKVNLSRVAMLRYPHERDVVVVTFEQDYRSNGLSNVMKKRQYWVKEGARWKILYEGAA